MPCIFGKLDACKIQVLRLYNVLEQFRELGFKEGRHYVHMGSVPGHKGVHTHFHNRGRIIIERRGYLLRRVDIEKGRCRFCDTNIPGRCE